MFHIVDDEETFAELLLNMTQVLGHEASIFPSALHYIEYLNSDEYEEPTAIITDVRMPGMNGYELMGYVAITHPQINFIVMSGEASIQHEHKDKACMYLKKPFEYSIYSEMLKKLVRCEREGASPDIGCAEIGDREFFGVADCPCPKECRLGLKQTT